jgi:hypothetical protein
MMNASRLASLKGACADPARRRKHCGDFPFTPPTPQVGAAAFWFAKRPARVVEARERIP